MSRRQLASNRNLAFFATQQKSLFTGFFCSIEAAVSIGPVFIVASDDKGVEVAKRAALRATKSEVQAKSFSALGFLQVPVSFREVAHRITDWISPAHKGAMLAVDMSWGLQTNSAMANFEKWMVVAEDLAERAGVVVASLYNRDAIIQKGEADFFREFAYDVPALVLFKLVGIPDADVPKVKSWGVSRSLLTWGNLSDQEQVPHAHNMVEYWRYCQDLVRQRREHEGDDLPTDLLRDQKSGGEISDDEIAGVLYSVLFAGHETTTTLMANGVRELLAHRDNWEALIADPSLIPSAVDEVLRYAPSIVAWRRKALKDTSIAGVAVPQGSNILLLLGSANRDQTVFADAQHFDVHRKDARKHLAFGYGIHTCVGQQLAKIEFTIALEELVRRMPHLRLTPGQKFEFTRNSSFRVLTALHVEWKAT